MPIEGIEECPKCGKAPMAQDPDSGDYFCVMCGPKPWEKRHWFWLLVDIAFLPVSIPLHWVIKGVKFERDLGKLVGMAPCDCPSGRVFINGTYAGCVACGRGIPQGLENPHLSPEYRKKLERMNLATKRRQEKWGK